MSDTAILPSFETLVSFKNFQVLTHCDELDISDTTQSNELNIIFIKRDTERVKPKLVSSISLSELKANSKLCAITKIITTKKSKRSYNRCKCPHGHKSSTCKECKLEGIGGSQICDHLINRYICAKCKELGIGGSGICSHGNVKSLCNECKETGEGGGSLCTHGIRRVYCVECKYLGIGGNMICDHDNIRPWCLSCWALGIGGENYCIHGIDARVCDKCI